MTRVGVIALQGDFLEHIEVMQSLGVEAVEVRLPRDLEGLDGLIIPGGESTTIGRLMKLYGLMEPIKLQGQREFPIWGVCAGMILLAKNILGSEQPSLGLMDMDVKRNAFGRQVDSFEVDLAIAALGKELFRAVFIRAPVAERVGPQVEVMAHLPNGGVVVAKQGNLLVSAFHPELTQDLRFHRYFLSLIRAHR